MAVWSARPRTGRAWANVRDSETAAAAMGIAVARHKASAFVVSSGYAGLTGAMLALAYVLARKAIAREAGYAPASFYKHFDDKTAILLAVYENYVRLEWEGLRAAMGYVGAGSLADFRQRARR